MDKLNKQEKEALKKGIKKQVKELDEIEQVKDLIKNNQKEFKVEDITYRIRKANSEEASQSRRTRAKKNLELLEDDAWIPRKQLIKIYKKKGIDIDEMENQIKRLESEKELLDLKLIKLVDKNAKIIQEKKIETVKDMVDDVEDEIDDYLDTCLEVELAEYCNKYLIWLVLEKKVEDKWQRAFETFKDFEMMDNDELLVKAIYFYGIISFKNKIK